MTLVLNFLSNDFVVQAADRRLTMSDGTTADERATKSIFFCGHFAFAYTGLAEVQGKEMADWITDQLASRRSIDDAIHHLANRATEAFKAIRLPASVKRTAIAGIGWAKLVGTPQPDVTGENQAIGFTISNFIEPDGSQLARANSGFEPLLHIHKPWSPASFDAVGQPLTPDEREQLRQGLRQLFGSAGWTGKGR